MDPVLINYSMERRLILRRDFVFLVRFASRATGKITKRSKRTVETLESLLDTRRITILMHTEFL
jgi:hypothetical protein